MLNLGTCHGNGLHIPALHFLNNEVYQNIFDKKSFLYLMNFCIPQCGTYRIVFEENMAPLVFDIDEGGEHDGNHEDNDGKNDNLGDGR